jgi:hypothetical protein
MPTNYTTTANSIFITAADARQNPIRERVVFDEGTAISAAILEAVRTGFYNALVNDGTTMTQNYGVIAAVNSINDSTSTFEIPNHPWNTGDAVFVNSTGELPSPLATSTLYYVIYVDQNDIQLAATKQAALAKRPVNISLSSGVNSINLTNQGGGYSATPTVTISGGNATVAATAQAYLAPYGQISYIATGSNGNGYHYPPTVEIVGQGSGATAGAASFIAVTATVNQGGQNYAVGQVLSVIGGTGTATQATITSTIGSGAVETVTLTSPGLYSVLPSLGNVATSVSPGGGTGATLDLSMGIGNIALSAPGQQYTAPPLVTISGGGGVGASAYTALSAGTVNNIFMSAPGMGFSSQPTITISSGSGAQATAYLQPTGVGNISLLTNGGSTYTHTPNVSIQAAGSGATVSTVYMQILTATLTSGGAGSQYVVGDTLIISGGEGSASATITVNVVDSAGSIVNYTLTTSGLYSILPTMQGNAAFGGSGQAAAFNLTAGINSIQLSSGGTGYTQPPTVVITPSDGTGYGASAYTLLSGSSVSNVVVSAPGTGYDAAPNIYITSGSGATASANLVATSVQFVNMSNTGSGYTYANVTFDSQFGIYATATATVVGGQVQSITVTDGGQGYVQAPLVIITGDGTGAAATVTLTPTPIASLTITNQGTNYTSIPTVAVDGAATANVSLYSTGIQQIVVTNGGQDYSSAPQVNIVAGAGETAQPIQPSTTPIIGFSISTIAITSQGQGYQSAPTVTISAPQNLNGNLATATATIGYGAGTMSVIGYPASYDYYLVSQGGNALDPNLTRPYADQMGTIINYFQNLGYTITQQTNPNTNRTFQWNVQW